MWPPIGKISAYSAYDMFSWYKYLIVSLFFPTSVFGVGIFFLIANFPDVCLFVAFKYNVGLKTLLSEGLSEPEFYGDLVYKFKKLKGINDFSFQFRKIITRYRRIGYNLNVMRQSACLVFNPIMVDNYAAFFNCTPVGRASDSMMAPT